MVLLDLSVGLISLILAYVPVFLYTGVLWYLDRYEREPLFLIAAAFLWGAFGSVIFSLALEIFFSLPLTFFPEMVETGISTIVMAPVIEEVGKALLLFILFFYYEFDNVTDGILYGAVVGFGFSATENLIYLYTAYAGSGIELWFTTLLLRLLLLSMAHGFLTAITGAGFGFAKTHPKSRYQVLYPSIGLIGAIAMHSVINILSVLTQNTSALFLLVDFMVIAGGTLTLLILLLASLEHESNVLKEELKTEVEKGFITQQEYRLVHHSLLRRKAARRIDSEYGREKSRELAELFNQITKLGFQKRLLPYEPAQERIHKLRNSINDKRERLMDVIPELENIH